MKKINILALLLAIMLLQGCATGQGSTLPAGWDESWTRLGTYLGVEPMEGFRLDENNDALAVSGLYYATWVTGPARDHTNDEGEAAKVYDAQIYVLVQVCRSEAAAATQIGAWIARESQSYTTDAQISYPCGDQTFDLLPLLTAKNENPYTHGMAAFASRGQLAICVELLCAEDYAGEPQAVIEAFLGGFHYNP